MTPLSSWAIAAQEELSNAAPAIEKQLPEGNLKIYNTHDSLWLVLEQKKGPNIAFRMTFTAGGQLNLRKHQQTARGYQFVLDSSMADYQVSLELPDQENPAFHYTTKISPKVPLLVPFWPRDILPLTKSGRISNEGKVHVQQVGLRSGLIFMSMAKPQTGSLFYFQNLTALSPYCQATKTSLAGVVGGKWPELGFTLPVTKDDPLPEGEEFVISDAYILLTEETPADNAAVTRQFLNHMALLYLIIPKPEPAYADWLAIAEKGLEGLANHKGCWTFAGGHPYLNAYVCDYKTPAEIMVQLSVLLPLIEYCEWKGEFHQMVPELKNGLPAFYLDELKTVVRWIPAMEDNLDKSEEQKRERVMDSWYLHHPLLNLARLAQKGDQNAKKLLLDAIDYAINVAHHFKYEWPVFYRMDTLKVIKAETEPGKGGEKDVPGGYAHLMLELWKLTGAQRYLDEAQKAAKKLIGQGFDIFYQANNTAFSAKALLRLYKKTKDRNYLDLSYCCLAGIFKNVQLWDCNYGNGKHFPSFFAIYPLNDAPYTAAYEEQEVCAGLIEYLQEAEDVDILPSVRLLIAEFIRHAIGRLPYYYPPLLSKDMLAKEVKTGEIDPGLWIPLEDLHDGWEQSGEVGQEVYGAGIAFGIVPRQYYKVPAEDFIVFIDYPVSQFKISKNKSITIKVSGDERLSCRLAVLPGKNAQKKDFSLTIDSRKKQKEHIKPSSKKADRIDFVVGGNQMLKLKW